MPLANNAQVLVVDGRKMLLFRNHGDAGQIDLRTEDHEERSDASDRDMKTDQAGQSAAPGGSGLFGGTMGETDYHQQEEDRFAVRAAELLNKQTLAGDAHPLAIIAAPKTLGVLRSKLHKEVEKRIVLELAKDLTNQPIPAIEKALMAASETELPA